MKVYYEDIMVAPRFRSRKNRRVSVKTPGGRLVLHDENKTYGKPQCGQSGETLKGISIGTSTFLMSDECIQPSWGWLPTLYHSPLL